MKGSSRYRVAVGHGETRTPGGVHGVAYARQKLTVYLTVPSAMTARDPQSDPRAGMTTRGETR